ncbi:CIS tube protein [Streptacidiphilus anmyonensis]|uniref:CIS tube protein n=1 Tax=Streptacidiphilus anmyonensis TaxID=405782 RepID=UPI0013649358|nr:LysM peptidoglycan-binding domain-containing protein [Streptacidiphilus anmyonensis]
MTAPGPGAVPRATLSEIDAARPRPANGIVLDYNPTGVSVRHRSAPLRRPDQTQDEQPVRHEDYGSTELAFTSVTFDGSGGRTVAAVLGQLLAWSTPLLTDTTDKVSAKKHTPLEFTWGRTVYTPVELRNVTADITRFSDRGVPLRATVDLVLHVLDPDPAKSTDAGEFDKRQNPTSGGRPGHGAHTVVEGDTLGSVAQAAFGDAGQWRRIADASGIEDPLRLRPGRRLRLPSRQDATADGEPR